MAEYTGSTVLDILLNNHIPNGTHTFTVNGVTLNGADKIRVVNIYGDSNSIIGSGIDYALDENDKTIVSIVHGNLTVNSSQSISIRCKGFFLLVKGKLTIGATGLLNLTGGGASGAGQEVRLCTVNSLVQSVPASSSSTRAGITATTATGTNSVGTLGGTGNAATGRGTGGGGSGGAHMTLNGAATATSGSGSAGTSWSGGSGGGGIAAQGGTFAATSVNNATAGGAGGAGRVHTVANSTRYAGGGAGHSGGTGRKVINSTTTPTNNATDEASFSGQEGAGGLVVIYAMKSITNSALVAIESKGVQGGTDGTAISFSAGGGGSGGGSVNVFYAQTSDLTTSQIDVSGGDGGFGSQGSSNLVFAHGGTGGAGSKTITALYSTLPRQHLFLIGNDYKKFVPSATNGTWVTVGSTSDSDAQKQTMFLEHGMLDEDLSVYMSVWNFKMLTGSYGTSESAVATLQTYVP